MQDGREKSNTVGEKKLDPNDNGLPPTPGFKRFYADRSLGHLHLDNPLRRWCMWTSESPWFDNFILAAIVANALILCQMEPLKLEGRGCTGVDSASRGGNNIIDDTELVFTTIFTLEAIIKIIAMGFLLDDTSYLKDGWNVLDFTVVVVSLLSNLPGMGSNVSALRVIRVLRPLRTLSILPGMRVLIGTMIKSVPMIANVMVFCVFFFTIFGIFGLQVFMGVLRNRCFTVVTESTCADHAEADGNVFCREIIPNFGDDRNLTAAVLLEDNSEQTCTNVSMHWEGYHCPAGQMCLKAMNPNRGITHFDNIAHAWLTIFQCITLEGWTPLMYMCMDAITGWSVVYFVLLVFTGGFFLLNLVLAVVTEVYDEENSDAKEADAEAADAEAEEKEKKEAEAREKRHAMGVYTDDDDSDDDAVNVGSIDLDDLDGEPKMGIRTICRAIIDAWWFNPLFVILILVNTLVLALEYDGMPKSYSDGLAVTNLVLSISFIVEMVLKIIGLGFSEYGNDRFNLFDAVVVIISIIELAMSGGGGLSALRAFRILRVLKLIRSWRSLQNFLYTIYLTVLELGNFSFIVILTIFIFALLGMQMFGGKMCGLDDGDTPRHNFDTLLWALVTVFQVLTGEDWNAVMYDGVAAAGSWSSLYFVALLIIGNFLVLNLFVAILLTNFGEQEVRTEYESAHNLLNSVAFFKAFSKEKGKLQKSKAQLAEQKFWDELPDKDFSPRAISGWERLSMAAYEVIWEEEDAKAEEEAAEIAREEEAREARLKEEQAVADGIKKPSGGKLVSFELAGKGKGGGTGCGPMPGAAPKPLHKYKNKALYIFTPENPIRKFCYAVVDDKQFEYVIMSFIVISSFTMIFENPKAMEDKSFANALDGVDILFTIIFALEMLMKLVAFGLYSGDTDAYLRDAWNCLDGFIVVIGIIGKILSGYNLGWVRSLRTMRVLRPLRVISRVPELKVVVNALFNSLPGMGNVLMVSLLFWLIFGILGMQLFMGAFARCSDDDVDSKVECVDGIVNATVTMKWDTITKSCNYPHAVYNQTACVGEYNTSTFVERTWKSDDMNFDNVFNAMQTLFEMSTTEGWTAVMYNGVDSRSPELAPKRDHNPPIAFFFVVFMVIGNFFILNLFIGIILDNFAQLSSESGDGGSELMTKSQKMWVKTQQKLQKHSSPEKADYYPPDPQRKQVYKFVELEQFEWFIMGVIVLNAIAMAAEQYDQSQGLTDFLEGMGYFFAAVFVGEAALKLYAMYPSKYFSDRWNCFDFFCVATTIIGFMAGSGGGASALRVLRLARVFRLIRKLKGLQMLFNTLIISLPGLLNIGALMFLLCFVYAILGMNLFGKVKFGENLNEEANFRDFGQALLLLVRAATGEAWNAVMYDCMIDTDCDKSVDCAIGECCGSDGAPLYFISFIVFGSFITLNLLIAVVIDNFSNNKKEEGVNVKEEHVADFAEAWKKLDPHATGFIPINMLVTLLKTTSQPLGVKGARLSRLGILRFQKNLKLTVESNYLHYQDVLSAVTAHAMGIDVETLPPQVHAALENGRARNRGVAEKKLQREMEAPDSALSGYEIAHGMKGHGGEQLDVAQMYAVERMQAAFRGFQARKRMRMEQEARLRERSKAKAEHILNHIKGIFIGVEEDQARRNRGAVKDSANASEGDRDSAQGL